MRISISRIKEAETCYGMGMVEEALHLYQLILDSDKSLSANVQQVLTEKIAQLKDELKKLQEVRKEGAFRPKTSRFSRRHWR